MSYSEQDGQVILTMSREDYERILFRLGAACGVFAENETDICRAIEDDLALLNRLNQGNPNYTPYQTGGKSDG